MLHVKASAGGLDQQLAAAFASSLRSQVSDLKSHVSSPSLATFDLRLATIEGASKPCALQGRC
jgi:hypothetical protein